MKHGRRPTRRQMIAIKEAGLTPDNWLVVKDLTDTMTLVHRSVDQTKVIHKG